MDGYDFRYVYGLDLVNVKVTGAGSNWWGQSIKQCIYSDYVHTDRLGSVVNLSDQFGRVPARVDYDAWGRVTAYESITVTGGFRVLLPEITYAGHQYDDILDQYYAKARMYDADNRRFTSVDPVKGNVMDPLSLVQYLYVINNPLTYIDPLGTMLDKGAGDTNSSGVAVVASAGSKKNSPAEVIKIQTMLKKVGLYDDAIDGSYGPNTKQGVLDFQKRYGMLNNSGIVDADTFTLLRFVSSSSENANYAHQQDLQEQKHEAIMGRQPPVTVPAVSQQSTGLGGSMSAQAGAGRDPVPEMGYFEKFGCDAQKFFYMFKGGCIYRTDELLDIQGIGETAVDLGNWFTYGALEANGARYQIFVEEPSLFTFIDYISMGGATMVKGTFMPEEPLSFEHWLNSLGSAAVVTGAYFVTRESIARYGQLGELERINSATGSIVSTQYSPANPGPLPERIADTFTGGVYRELVLTEDTTFYRVYGGKAGEVGGYMTRTPQNGSIQSRIDLALNPVWGNTAENITTEVVPKGTVIYEGTAAPQGSLLGGANQVYIPEVNAAWFGH